jgi:hypothetical protein
MKIIQSMLRDSSLPAYGAGEILHPSSGLAVKKSKGIEI